MCASNFITTVYKARLKNKWLIQSVWKNLTGLQKAKSWSQLNTSGVTVNADLEPKTHHQTPMTCTYEYSHFRVTPKTVATEMEIQFFKYINYGSIFVATVLDVPFSVLKRGSILQVICAWWWVFVSRTAFTPEVKVTPQVFNWDYDFDFCRPVKFFHTDWINHFLFEPCLIHRGIVMLE